MSIPPSNAYELYRDAVRQSVRKQSRLLLIQGILLIVAGVLAMLMPAISSVAVVLVLGWLLILSGLLQGMTLIGAGKAPHFWLQLISMVLSVLIGLLLLTQPELALVAITLLLIVFFMIDGVSKFVFALAIRPLPHWLWLLASGVLGIVLSLLLWANLSTATTWLLGFLLGIELIGTGAAMAWFASQLRKAPESA